MVEIKNVMVMNLINVAIVLWKNFISIDMYNIGIINLYNISMLRLTNSYRNNV